MKFLSYTLLFFIAIQFITIEKDNPPFDKDAEIVTDKKIKIILKKACYDCHSNEVKYSIYANIAPLSWGIRSHIKKGRLALNFSTWRDMNPSLKEQRVKKLSRVIRKNQMPLASYIYFHPDAILTQIEKNSLYAWIDKDLLK